MALASPCPGALPEPGRDVDTEPRSKSGLASHGVSFTGIMDLSGESMPLSVLLSTQSKAGKQLNQLLTPRGPQEIKGAIAHDVLKKREQCQWNAWHFLTTGESLAPSPYGGDWNRDYNPNPYEGAKPKNVDMYEGTGVGLLYRIQGADHMAWSLAGWNITRRGTEQRSRRKK